MNDILKSQLKTQSTGQKTNEVIVITGPTASGKAHFSHQMARILKTEIIVADSMKVYKYADIATAKPDKAKRKEIKYHLLDIIEPDQRYDVGSFYKEANSIIRKLHEKKCIPVISGGTPLYIQKLMDGLADIPMVPAELIDSFDDVKTEELYDMLQDCDPQRAENLQPLMRKRIIRALAVYRHTGKKMSSFLSDTVKPSLNFIVLGLKWERKKLYERIENRIDMMISKGMIDEVKYIYSKFGSKSPIFEAIGYKEFLPYLKGSCSLEEAVSEVKKSSRNYAKRQLTWWRSKDIIWLEGEKIAAD